MLEGEVLPASSEREGKKASSGLKPRANTLSERTTQEEEEEEEEEGSQAGIPEMIYTVCSLREAASCFASKQSCSGGSELKEEGAQLMKDAASI